VVGDVEAGASAAGLGLENDHSSEQRREQPIEQNKDQPIRSAQLQLGRRRPRRDEKLLAEKYNFSFVGHARSKQSDEISAQQLQEVAHPPSG
jgi:hypothetical protein